MAKRARSWENEFERQSKKFISENKFSESTSNPVAMQEVYERTMNYLYEGAQRPELQVHSGIMSNGNPVPGSSHMITDEDDAEPMMVDDDSNLQMEMEINALSSRLTGVIPEACNQDNVCCLTEEEHANMMKGLNPFMGSITCKCKLLKQTTLERFWLDKKATALRKQEGSLSPKIRHKALSVASSGALSPYLDQQF